MVVIGSKKLKIFSTWNLRFIYNYDYNNNIFKKDCISGKYLNEIHLKYVKFDFYTILSMIVT